MKAFSGMYEVIETRLQRRENLVKILYFQSSTAVLSWKTGIKDPFNCQPRFQRASLQVLAFTLKLSYLKICWENGSFKLLTLFSRSIYCNWVYKNIVIFPPRGNFTCENLA